MPTTTVKNTEDKPTRASDGPMIIKTLYVTNKEIKIKERACVGFTVGELHSPLCDSTVDYRIVDNRMHITGISTQGNKAELGHDLIGSADACVDALRKSGLLDMIEIMEVQKRWDAVVIEVSEIPKTNEIFESALSEVCKGVTPPLKKRN